MGQGEEGGGSRGIGQTHTHTIIHTQNMDIDGGAGRTGTDKHIFGNIEKGVEKYEKGREGLSR